MAIVAGKGGVGKTAVSAALARCAAAAGRRTLLVELDGRTDAAPHFGVPPYGYDAVEVVPPRAGEGAAAAWARSLTGDAALVDYLQGRGLGRLARRLVAGGAMEVVATATPGLREILLLGKVKQLVAADVADLIVVDAPATGHAVALLAAPGGLLGAVRAGPIRHQAHDVAELLADADRCTVLLVTIPEETPVNEVVDAAFRLEDEAGVRLGPVVVNAVYPALAGLDGPPAATDPAERRALQAAADLRLARSELQRGQLDRLAEALPLSQLRLPFLFTTAIGPAESETLASALAPQLEGRGAPSEVRR